MSSADVPWKLRREIVSDTSIGSSLAIELLAAMKERGWSSEDMFRTQLAFEEAVVNAIRHGNRCDPAKKVLVEMDCDESRVMIQITDEGDGFALDQVPDPRQEDLLEVPGGRGVLLINETMNEVSYNDTGNRITMLKRKGEPRRVGGG